MKTLCCLLVVLLLCSTVGLAEGDTCRNLILFVADGMGPNAVGIARYALGNEARLVMDETLVGMVRTAWAGGPIPDSAPAATAFATGARSTPAALGVDADGRPRATILEAAQLVGKSVGIVCTSEFMHATPAAFTSHVKDRSNYAAIAKQMTHQGLDVLLGSGSGQSEINATALYKTLQEQGYDILKNREELLAYTGNKAWGDFESPLNGRQNLSYALDRSEQEPSLAEMTGAAINILSQNEAGFFLMVEASKIDWALHANDTVAMAYDILALDDAFAVALGFAKSAGDTLVVVVADHGTGGPALGVSGWDAYYKASFDFLNPLRRATASAEGAMAIYRKSGVKAALSAYGLDPNSTHTAVKAFRNNPTASNLIKAMNATLHIGYTTTGHTGDDVPLYAFGPGFTPRGLYDADQLGRALADALGVSLTDATVQLFVNTDAYGPGESMRVNNRKIYLESGIDLFYMDGAPYPLHGQIPVHVNGHWYAPQTLLDIAL